MWRSLGEALGPFLRPEKKKLQTMSEIWRQYGRLGVLGAPLGRSGIALGALVCLFAATERQNSVQKCPKYHLGGIVKIMLFLYVLYGFMRLAAPNGRPNDGLEAFLDHLGAHAGHFGDMCAPLWLQPDLALAPT